MQKSLFEQFKENWVINILGLIFFCTGFFILNINEGRSFQQHSFLNDAYREVISMTDTRHTGKSPNYEGKLIHLTGEIEVQEALGESAYNLIVQAVKLRKIVEMFQWHEEYTDKFGDEEDMSRSYYYYKDWSEVLIDSKNFHSLSHENPKKKPMDSRILIAEKVFLGGFEISDEAKDMFNSWVEVTSDTRPDDFFIKMHGNAYYHVEDLFDIKIGEFRVRFQFAGLDGDTYTIVGKFEKGKIVPYTNESRKKILLLSKGKLTKEDIFHKERSVLSKELWFGRLFAYILITFFVISTESIAGSLLEMTPLSFLIVSPHKFASYLKVSAFYTIGICIFRHVLYYIGIL